MRKQLRIGDQCPAVAVLQGVLTVRNLMNDGKTGLDDRYELGTDQGVRQFQAYANGRGAHEVKVNGIVDEPTMAAMHLYLGVDLASLPDSFWPVA